MREHLCLFSVTSVSAFLSFVLCTAARAAVTLSSPADNASVPLQQDGHKTYFAMTPRATRWTYMDSDGGRKAMIATTSRPKAVRLAWSGGTAPYTVTVHRAHDNALFVSTNLSAKAVDLYNFEVGRKYTWQVTDKTGAASASRTFATEADAPRFLRVGVSNTVNFTNGLERSSGKASLNANGPDFLPNVRDVGGVYTADGTKRMKQGLVYRSYEFCKYGSTYLPFGVDTDVVCGQLGVKTDLDLRSTNEVASIVNAHNSQSPLNASAHSVEWIHCPIAKYDAELIGTHEQKALALFTSTAKLPLIFHCMCGQDRTGCLALYLYAILGVDDETMLKSWEASSFFQGDNNWSESDPGFRSYRIQGFIDSFRAYGTASDSLATCVVKALKAKNVVTDENIANIRATLLETDPDEPTGTGYQSLHESLITDGVGYIDTGYTPNLATTKVELKLRQLTPSTGKGIGGYFSAGNDLYLQRWNSYDVSFGYHGASTKWLVSGMDDTTSDYIVWTDGRTSGFGSHTLTATNAQVTASASATLKLFCGIYEYPSGSGTYAGVPMQLYYCKIYENGTLVHEYVPAKSLSGVATLYDSQAGTCLVPTNAGGFSLGAKTGGDPTSEKKGFERAREEGRPPRVLVIGNSFTQGVSRDVQYNSDGTTVKETRTHFPTAVRAMGEQIDYCALYRGGSTIQQHYEGRATRGFFAEIDWSFDSAAPSWSTAKKGMLWLDEDGKTKDNRLSETLQPGSGVDRSTTPADTSLEDILLAVDWDVIMIQEASVVAPFFNKGTNEWTGVHAPEPFRDYETGTERMSYGDPLRDYVAYLKAKSPHAELWWHQTWALHPETTSIDLGTDAKRDGMYDAVNTNAERVAQTYGLKIMPTGYAVQLYRYQLPVTQRAQDPCSFDTRHINGGYYVYGSNPIPAEQRYRTYLQMMTWCQRFYGKMPTAGATAYEPSVAAEKTLMRSCALQAANATSYRDYGQAQPEPPAEDPSWRDAPFDADHTIVCYGDSLTFGRNSEEVTISKQDNYFDGRLNGTTIMKSYPYFLSQRVPTNFNVIAQARTGMYADMILSWQGGTTIKTARAFTLPKSGTVNVATNFLFNGTGRGRIAYNDNMFAQYGGMLPPYYALHETKAEMGTTRICDGITGKFGNIRVRITGDRATNLTVKAVSALSSNTTIPAGTTFVPDSQKTPYKDAIQVIFVGTNDGTNNYQTYIAEIQTAVANIPSGRYVVVSSHRKMTMPGETDSQAATNTIEKAFAAAFGNHHLNLRRALYDKDATWETDGKLDTTETDKLHFTADGYDLVSEIVYDKLNALGYLSGVTPVDPPEPTSPITLKLPANGSTLALYTTNQKKFFALTYPAIKTQYTGFDASMTNKYLRIRPTFTWSGASGAVTVTVTRQADGAVLQNSSLASGTTSCKVLNLEAGTAYRWTVTDAQGNTASATFTTEGQAPRILYSSKVPSIRDLGGWVGLQGCRVRSGQMFRTAEMNNSGAACRLSEDERNFYLNVIGMRTEVDFRASTEVEGLAATSPIGDAVTYVRYPIKPYVLGTFEAGEDKPYGWMRLSFDKAFNPETRPMIFHCKIGRDRTGTFAALTFALLGVSEDDIYREYRIAGDFPTSDAFQIDQLVTLLKTTYPADTLAASTKRYFTEALGYTAAEVEQFRTEMLVGYVPEGGSSLALSAPANGGTVAFFTSEQKNFFALSGDAIKTSYTGFDSSMIDPMLRQGVNLAWTGASGALTLTVCRVADGQTLVSAALPAGTTSYVARNLELGTEYRWTVTDAQGGTASRTFTTEAQSPRILYSAQVPSMRDLGGWTGLQGCRVKQNELFRTGQMDAPSSGNLLTAAEQDFLANTLGIKTDIDFRYPSETKGLSGSPIGSSVTYCQYPIEPYALGTFSETEDNPYGYMRLSFRKAFDASARPLIFHCKHGRDRTGTFAAITLALLGVSEDDICREYRVAGDMPQGAGKYKIDTLLPLLTTGYPAESLAASAKRYFIETLNFTDAEVEQFRSELLVGYVKPTDPPVKTVYTFVGNDAAGKSSFAGSTAGATSGWATNGTVLTHSVAAGNDYVIPSGAVLRTSSSADFKGDTLTLAGTILLKGKPLTLGFPSLVSDGGSLLAGDSNQSVTLNGAIEIPTNKTLGVSLFRSDSTAATVTTLAAKLTGAGTLSVGGASVTAVSSVAQTLVLSDADGFAGTLSAAVLPYAQNFVLKVTGGFGGAVAALPTGTTKAVFNYAALDGAKGVRIAATTVPSGLATGLVLYGVADATAANLPLMTFPAGTVLDPTAFTVRHAATVDGAATAFANLGVIANADGTQTLAANVTSGGTVVVDGKAVSFDAATFTDTDKVNSQKTVVFATQPTVSAPTASGTPVIYGGKTVVMQPYYDVSFTATTGGYKMVLALNETATPAIADEAETPAIAVTGAGVNVHVANRQAGLWYALGAADAPNASDDAWQIGTYVKDADPTALRALGETQKFYKVFVRDYDENN